MTPIDIYIDHQRPAMVQTVGVSETARFAQGAAKIPSTKFSTAYSLDDGRHAVHNELMRQFMECSTPGWDGYGANPVQPETFANARRLISAMPRGIAMPTVSAEADGHLSLEWYKNPRRVLSVSVSPDGYLHFAALLGGESRRNGTEAFLGELPPDLLGLIRSIVS